MAKKNKFISEVYKVAQVHKNMISASTFDLLRNLASYTDTDKGLSEFLVSTEAINEHLAAAADLQVGRLMREELEELYKEVKKYEYVNITSI